jgi:hypothetical protein
MLRADPDHSVGEERYALLDHLARQPRSDLTIHTRDVYGNNASTHQHHAAAGTVRLCVAEVELNGFVRPAQPALQ